MSCSANLRLFLLAGIVFNISHFGWNRPLISQITQRTWRRLFTMTGKPCEDLLGNVGVCMFKLDCINRNGISLSTCVDGFLFGACCKLENTTTQTIHDAGSSAHDIDGNITAENPITLFWVSQIYNTKSYERTINHSLPVTFETQKSTDQSNFYDTSTNIQDLRVSENENLSTGSINLITPTTEIHTEDKIYVSEEDGVTSKFMDRNTGTKSSENNIISAEIEKPYISNYNMDSDRNFSTYNQNESMLSILEISSESENSTDNLTFVTTLSKNESTSYDDIFDDHGIDSQNLEEVLTSVSSSIEFNVTSENEATDSLSIDSSFNDISTYFFSPTEFYTTESSVIIKEEKFSNMPTEDDEDLLPFTASHQSNITADVFSPSSVQVNLTKGNENLLEESKISENLLSNNVSKNYDNITPISSCGGKCSLSIFDEANNSIDSNSPTKLKMPYTNEKSESIQKLQKPIEIILNASNIFSNHTTTYIETIVYGESENSTHNFEVALLTENENLVTSSALITETIPELNTFEIDPLVNLLLNVNATKEDEIATWQITENSFETNLSVVNDRPLDAFTDDSLLTWKLENAHSEKNITENSLRETIKEHYETPDSEIEYTSHIAFLSEVTAPSNITEKTAHAVVGESDKIIGTAENTFVIVNDNQIVNDTESLITSSEDNQINITDAYPQEVLLYSEFTSGFNDALTQNSSNQLSTPSQKFSSSLEIAIQDTQFVNSTEVTTNIIHTFNNTLTINSEPISSNDSDDTSSDSLDITTSAYDQESPIIHSHFTDPLENLIGATTIPTEKPTEYPVSHVTMHFEETEFPYDIDNTSSVSSLIPLDAIQLIQSTGSETATKPTNFPMNEETPFHQVSYYENTSLTYDTANNFGTQEMSVTRNSSYVYSIVNFSTFTPTMHQTDNMTPESTSEFLELSSIDIRNITNSNGQLATTPIAFVTSISNFISPHEEQEAISSHNIVSTYQDFTTPSQLYNDKRGCGVRRLRPFGRIVGGRNTYFGKWPWQALVKEATWLGLFVKNKCGGVLINTKYVITAAHCQPGFLATLVVVLGAHDLTGAIDGQSPVARNVRRMVVHRHYNPLTFENDLALLEMESPVDFLPHVVPICLPNRNEDFTGKMAYVTGWGKLTHGGDVPNILQEVQVPIVTNKDCQKMFLQAGHPKAIRYNFVCAGYRKGGQDSCEGDSGGPLVVQRDNKRWVLVGTVSHGIGCADENLPGVYMRMAAYRPWIDSIINK